MVQIKRGQVSIFVIIAIVIVAAVVLFFAIRGGIFGSGIPGEFQGVYDAYGECIMRETQNGLSLLGTQGGRIESNFDDFVSGSSYAPFSSHLNFLGFNVPYWFYVSGNGIITENVPTKSEMEGELENYIEGAIEDCELGEYYAQGFYIESGEPEVNVQIGEVEVEVSVDADVLVSREGESARKSAHEVVVASRIGKFHDTALEIYEKQSSDAFLEAYGVDVLRSYAPVDGVSVQCAPEIWNAREVVSELKNGLEANIASLKTTGSYYDLSDAEREYFVVDVETDEAVNFLYLESWPSKIEIVPSEGDVMIADPVGNQEGLGVIGFCYVPHHFVYDLSFPVMVQVHDGLEIFQFPIVVVIDNNLPREYNAEAYSFEYLSSENEFDLCEYKSADLEISLYDVNLNSVDGSVRFECFDQVCNLGESEGGFLSTQTPECTNGYLIVDADGFEQKKQLISTNSESSAEVILDKEYGVDVRGFVGGRVLSAGETAVISFVKDGKSEVVVLPENTQMTLSEGQYEVRVYVYGSSNIVIPASSKFQCVDVPRGGFAGIFGGTSEECFEIAIPETNVGDALIGGGKESIYILESELQTGSVEILVSEFGSPRSLEQLQYNYQAFESEGVDVVFG